MEIYVGLMSGTSIDGADAVIADFSATSPAILASYCHRFPDELKKELLALSQPANNELHHAALAANALANHYAFVVQTLLRQSGVESAHVKAIGCHGQTIRHRPEFGYSIQLVNGALLAELCGIDVLCDFRSRDIAAGGQGAPLVPAFHHAIFGDPKMHRVIVNIGGISNLTDLDPTGSVRGFDCGPGNILLDAWITHHLDKPYDVDGGWAKSGTTSADLLSRFLSDPYFHLPPPKSTGRDRFNLNWIQKHLDGNEAPEDVQSTLLQLSVNSIAASIHAQYPGVDEVYVCGGGARNGYLIDRLGQALRPIPLRLTDTLGVNANLVEAFAFAWLASRTTQGLSGNLASVTGAKGERILGAIYRAA